MAHFYWLKKGKVSCPIISVGYCNVTQCELNRRASKTLLQFKVKIDFVKNPPQRRI